MNKGKAWRDKRTRSEKKMKKSEIDSRHPSCVSVGDNESKDGQCPEDDENKQTKANAENSR